MCGPHHCLGRGAFASGAEILRRLLQLRQNASILEQGCAGHSPNSANRKHQITRHPWRTSPPLRPSLSFRYTHPSWCHHPSATLDMQVSSATSTSATTIFSRSATVSIDVAACTNVRAQMKRGVDTPTIGRHGKQRSRLSIRKNFGHPALSVNGSDSEVQPRLAAYAKRKRPLRNSIAPIFRIRRLWWMLSLLLFFNSTSGGELPAQLISAILHQAARKSFDNKEKSPSAAAQSFRCMR